MDVDNILSDLCTNQTEQQFVRLYYRPTIFLFLVTIFCDLSTWES